MTSCKTTPYWRFAAYCTLLCALLILTAVSLVQQAGAVTSTPSTMNFQGRLTNPDGTIVGDGTYNMQFRLYDAATGGTAVWSETREDANRVQVKNGLFSVQLGDVTPLTATVFTSSSLYFEITMATPATATCSTAGCASWESPMTPRNKLATSAYAFNAERLDGIDSSQFARNDVQNTYTADQLIRPTTNSTATFDIQTSGGASLLTVDTANAEVRVTDTVVGAGNSIKIVGGGTATRPASPEEGMLYYDSDTGQLLVYGNSKWQSEKTTTTKIVAASNAPQSVKDGADYVVDGTNDEVEINEALVAAAGGLVYLTEGTFTVGAPITPPANSILAGAGEKSIIKLVNGYDANINIIDRPSGSLIQAIEIRDVLIDGNKSNQTAGSQRGINFYNVGGGGGSTAVKGVTLDRVIVQNMTSTGIYLSHSDNSVIRDSVSRLNDASGLYVEYVDYSTITGNRTIANEGSGINVKRSTNNRIVDNLTTHNTARGIYFDSTNERNVIANNTAHSNTMDGIYLYSQNRNNTIDANTVTANGGRGIVVYWYGDGNTISDNVIANNSGDGIRLDRETHRSTVTGNIVKANAGWGIVLSGYMTSSTLDHNTVADNTLQSNTSGGIALSSVYNTTVTGNVIHDSGGSSGNNGIYIARGKDNQIISNNISDPACTSTCDALIVTSATPHAENTYFADNLLGGGMISDASSSSIYANQLDPDGNLTIDGMGRVNIGGASTDSVVTIQGSLSTVTLETPGLPTLTRTGASGSSSYSYVVTAKDGTGETMASSTRTIASAPDSLSATDYITVSWSKVSGATSYNIYRTASGGTPSSTGFIGTVETSQTATLTFADTGIEATGAVPTENTTGGATLAGNLSTNGVLTVNGTGSHTIAGTLNAGRAVFKHTADAEDAFQVQKSAGLAMLTVNSTDSRVVIGSATTDSEAVLLVVDSYNNSSDPTGVNGAMYYNSSLQKFRCYEDNAWADCISPARNNQMAVNILSSASPYSWSLDGTYEELGSATGAALRQQVNLSDYTEARLNFTTAIAMCTMFSKWQYSTDSGSSWSDGGSGPSHSSGLSTGSWNTLPAGAQTDVLIRMVGGCESGSATVDINSVTIQFR